MSAKNGTPPANEGRTDNTTTGNRDETDGARIPAPGINLQEHGALNSTDDEVAYARRLAEAGLELLLIAPTTKMPNNPDMRTARRDYGLAKADRDGLYLATSDPDLVEAYVRRHWHVRDRHDPAKALNLGVRLGAGSRLVLVDADTDDEAGAFAAWWAGTVGGDVPEATVATPGKQDASGAWVHKNGRHWWFRLPAGAELPENVPASVAIHAAGSHASVRVRDSYALIPPSVRPEGPYGVTGEVLTAPAALLEHLAASVPAPREPGDHDRAGSGPIDAWAASVTWDELLTEAGWTLHHKVESCGCPTWTRPGAGDPKSAVAHDPAVCHEGRTQLHLWSDTVATEWGRRDVTKAWFYALVWHAGDLAGALDSLGIARPTAGRVVSAEELGGYVGVSDDPHAPELLAELTESSDVLAHIVDQARARLVGPWAVLGASLLRAAALIPYYVTLPPIIGGSAGLNLLGVLTGASGSGKGAALSADVLAFDYLPSDPLADEGPWHLGDPLLVQDPETALSRVQVGSGEAISSLFRDWRTITTPTNTGGETKRKKVVTVARSRWVDFAEVDSVTALMRKESSQLSAELRKVFDTGALGAHTKSQELRTTVEAFTYRCVVSLGVQPENAGPLLGEQSGGLPQRMFWVSVTDPHAPDELPERSVLNVPAPAWERGDLTLAPEIVTELVTARRKVLREDADTSQADSHGYGLRLRVAGAFAALHSRAGITAEDWRLAGVFLQHSGRVQARVRRTLAEAGRQRAAARGASDAHRAEGARAEEDKRKSHAVEGLRAWAAKWEAENSEPFARSDAAKAAKSGSARRTFLDEALAELQDEGYLETAGENRSGSPLYRRAEAAS